MSFILFCIQSITNISCLFCNLLWANDVNWQACNTDNLFNNKLNIIPLIILKDSTNISAICNFDSFINSVDCDADQMFLITWNETNFIRCCTRGSTIIGTNIERVGVKLFLSNVSLEQDGSINLMRDIDLFMDVVLSLYALLCQFFKQLIVCQDEHFFLNQ